MQFEQLTLDKIIARPVMLKLNRPIVTRLWTIENWPLIVIDILTAEGVVGRSYLQPYSAKTMAYLILALNDLGTLFQGHSIAPLEMYKIARASLRSVGYQGQSMIAVSGFDMAVWDALSKAANLPLCVFLGGSLGPVTAYNSNGLWLIDPALAGQEAVELIAEGSFSALKIRLGRELLEDDLSAVENVRQAVGEKIRLMADFSQSLSMSEALRRCHAIDGLGLDWIEEPIVYDHLDGYKQLTTELKTPIQMGENFYGPRDLYRALQMKACDLVMPDLMRIGGITGWLKASATAGLAGVPVSSHLYPEFSAHMLRITETAHWLEWQDWATAILQDPYPVKSGQLEIPTKPGAGIEWNEDFIRAHPPNV